MVMLRNREIVSKEREDGARGVSKRKGVCSFVFFCQAEDGMRGLVRSRGLGDVYKRQG